MQCRDFREVADSYLSNELLVETNHDMIAHLEACAECRRELAARREMRTTLRASFDDAEKLRIRERFADRLSTDLRTMATTERSLISRRNVWLPIAAGLLLAAAVGIFVVWQQRAEAPEQIAANQPQEPSAPEMKAPDVQPGVAATAEDADMVLARMSETAAGDHRDCAINHRLPESPIDLDEAGRRFDQAYLGLTKAVRLRLSESNDEIELVAAHACLFKGRWFAHVILRYRGRPVSLLVTRLEDSASLAAKQQPAQGQHGQVIACSTVAGYQISCFHTARHAVFVVSDLSEGENLALAREMATSVYEHVTRAENVV
jgi:hypothetical protein